jgi:hypothetical protein
MRRITRDRKLTPEEAAKYRRVREQIAKELPELVTRHDRDVVRSREVEQEVLQQLDEPSAREASDRGDSEQVL